MLTNHAFVGHDGLLYVQGGAWEHVTPSQYPYVVSGVVAGAVELEPDEIGKPFELRIEIRTGARTDAHATGTVSAMSPRRLCPYAIPFAFEATEPGAFVIEIKDSDGPLARLDCELRPTPEPR
jgi:hypothetical protein